MATLDKTYSIKLDVKNEVSNNIPQYYVSDNQTSELLITITNGNVPVILDNVIVLMVAISPDKEKLYDFLDVRTAGDGLIYCNLKSQFKDLQGTWYARLMIISNEEKLVTDTFSYNVKTDDFIDMNDEVIDDDRYPLLTDIISRLSTIEITEISRQNIEALRVKEEKIRVANENTRIANEQSRQTQHSASIQSIDNKIVDIENRFRTMSASQQQSSEVIDARDGETSLHARLERDLAKGKVIEEKVEGAYNTVNDSVDGYLTDIELLGNTVQDSVNLADIQSVGTLEEDGRYKMSILSCGKNLFDGEFETGWFLSNGSLNSGNAENSVRCKNYIKTKEGKQIIVSLNKSLMLSYNPFYVFYDKNFDVVGTRNSSYSFTVPQNVAYFKIALYFANVHNNNFSNINLQIEERTQATTYEPYQYNKTSILLPCQLEKVGDVSDRLFRREDGIWCVEKNIFTYAVNGNDVGSFNTSSENTVYATVASSKINPPALGLSVSMCNKLPETSDLSGKDNEGVNLTSSGSLQIRVLKNKLDSLNAESFNKWVLNEKLILKYITTTPQIIELPLDAQIALNSFNGVTNIFTEDTVIEPTIKATVHKSLVSSIQSINEKTDNISQRVERVETLQKGSELTISSNKQFTTIEDTNSGYVTDFNIKGQTLNNIRKTSSGLYPDFNNTNTLLQGSTSKSYYYNVTKGVRYTFIKYPSDRYLAGCCDTIAAGAPITKVISTVNDQNSIMKDTFIATSNYFFVYGSSTNTDFNTILLEGDHTDKDLSFFEGLKSVGQGVDDIELIANFNEYDHSMLPQGIYCDTSTMRVALTTLGYSVFVACEPNTEYIIKKKRGKTFRVFSTSVIPSSGVVVNKTVADHENDIIKFTTGPTDNYLGVFFFSSSNGDIGTYNTFIKTIVITKKYNKKQLLYQNSEGVYEKPIIRGINDTIYDSIEKHSDGKYYYHKRCGEVVFDGSENWITLESQVPSGYIRIRYTMFDKHNGQTNILTDTFGNIGEAWKDASACESIAGSPTSNIIFVRLESSKLTSQDVAGFKQWLSQNPVTVVYQLATEEVYECVNLDLDSYEGETSVIFDGGAISPITSFKVTSHIGNVISKMKDNVAENTKFREELTESVTLYKESENGYLVAEDTKDGYVKDLKIEGKTLVNLATVKSATLSTTESRIISTLNFKPDTTYSIIFDVTTNTTTTGGRPLYMCFTGDSNVASNVACVGLSGRNCLVMKRNENIKNWGIGSRQNLGGNLVLDNIMILEGDHTQNTPSYFEGLKSVGDGVDKIEVLSRKEDGNLFDDIFEIGTINADSGTNMSMTTRCRNINFLRVQPNTKYTIKLPSNYYGNRVFFYRNSKSYISNVSNGNNKIEFITPNETYYIRLTIMKQSEAVFTQDDINNLTNKIYLCKGDVVVEDLNKQNKKQILYQTKEGVWEKPILRSTGSVADTIEKHSDGKYYYHKRCSEVLFDGSSDESWSKDGTIQTNTIRFLYTIPSGIKTTTNTVCDKFMDRYDIVNGDFEYSGILGNANVFYINILKTKLSSQDASGFKAWLQSNPVTVVYQLATEEVYECVNLDLDSYEGETSVIFDGGAISPKISMKISSRLANTIQILKDKVNYLENRVMDMFRAVLAGDVQTLAYELYPEDFKEDTQEPDQIESVEGTELL